MFNIFIFKDNRVRFNIYIFIKRFIEFFFRLSIFLIRKTETKYCKVFYEGEFPPEERKYLFEPGYGESIYLTNDFLKDILNGKLTSNNLYGFFSGVIWELYLLDKFYTEEEKKKVVIYFEDTLFENTKFYIEEYEKGKRNEFLNFISSEAFASEIILKGKGEE